MILEVIKETKCYGHTDGRSDGRTTWKQYTLPQTQFAGGITMMVWMPRCYIPSFVEIDQPVPEKKIFEEFLAYMGVAAILVMWPASCHQIFISLYLKAFMKNLVQIGTVVSEKMRFEFLYVHDLGPRSRNDLALQYSHTFIYLSRCLLLLTFRSLAATVSEKSTVFTFSYGKA